MVTVHEIDRGCHMVALQSLRLSVPEIVIVGAPELRNPALGCMAGGPSILDQFYRAKNGFPPFETSLGVLQMPW